LEKRAAVCSREERDYGDSLSILDDLSSLGKKKISKEEASSLLEQKSQITGIKDFQKSSTKALSEGQ